MIKKLLLSLTIGIAIGLLFMGVGYAVVWGYEHLGPALLIGIVGAIYGTLIALEKLPPKL